MAAPTTSPQSPGIVQPGELEHGLVNACESVAGAGLRGTSVVTKALRAFQTWPAFVAHAAAAAMAVYCVLLPSNETDMFAWARLVQMKHSPTALFDTWLVRGVGYKIFVYVQFLAAQALASLFSSPDAVVFYAGNFFLVVMTAAAAAYAALTLRDAKVLAASSQAIGTPTLFSCLFILMCAMPVRAFGEPEHLALLISVVLACMVLTPAPPGLGRLVTYALLTFVMASLKGLTVLFLVPVWLLALLLPTMSRTARLQFTIALALGVANYVVCLMSLAHEFQDLHAAARFQPPFQFGLHAIYRLFLCLVTYTSCQPSWLVVSLLAVPIAWQVPAPADSDVPSRRLLSAHPAATYAAGAIFLLSLLYALIQGELYSYHYVMLHLLSVLAILFLLFVCGENRYFVAMSVLAAMLAPVLSFAPHQSVDSFVGSTRTNACQAANGRAVAAALHAQGYDGKEPVLYLSGGGLNYYVDAPSFDRYFIMLPLQRAADDPSLETTAVYKETLKHVLSFRGKFIVWNPDWMDFDDTPGLEKLVIPDYQPVPMHGACNVNGLLLVRTRPAH